MANCNDAPLSEFTPEKNELLEKFIRMNIDMWGPKNRKFSYYYIDITAGPGILKDGSKGSPLIFLDAAHDKKTPYKAHLIEQNKETAWALHKNIAALNLGDRITVHQGDHNERLRNIDFPSGHGLLYCDVCGGVPPYDLLSWFSKTKRYRFFDILFTISGAGAKRTRLLPRYKRLSDAIRTIQKDKWYIRAIRAFGNYHPSDIVHDRQWTFCYGTNDPKELKWKNEGFSLIDTEQGRQTLKIISNTKAELKKGDQQELL